MKLTLSVLVLAAAAFCSVMDFQRAESVALGRIAMDGHTGTRRISSWFALHHEDGETPLAFVFELDPGGFIITSSENRLPPVIAYSYENGCRPEGITEGPLLQLVRRDLTYRMEHLPDAPGWYAEANHLQWAEMTAGIMFPGPMPDQWPPAGSTPTGGWLEENWTQNAPYNMYCPMDLIAGQRSVAGCPAVAMGAIINFHRETNGTRFDDGDDYYHNYHEYYWIDDDHEAHDFPSWPQLNTLLDTLEAHYAEGAVTVEDRASAVYASGAACRQVYTASVSGTFGVGQAYDAYIRFGFDECELLDEAADSLQERMAQNMMDAMPVHLAIIDEVPQYGHNVVVDGYNTDDFFHINFGWGGASNGWYSFPLTGMPYGMNFIEGVIVDIGEPMMSTGREPLQVPGGLNIMSVVNPAVDQLRVILSSVEDRSVELQVYSISGRLIISTGRNLGRGSSSISVAAGRLPAGVYLLRVDDGQGEDTAVFTVVR